MASIEKCALYLLMVFIIFLNCIDILRAQNETFNNTSVAIKCEECSQNCIQSNGSNTCGCNAGYVLDPDNKSCNAEIPVEILYINRGNLEKFSLHDNKTSTVLDSPNYIATYDFSYEKKSIFWTGFYTPLFKSKVDELNSTREIDVKYVSYINVIAYDWIHDHVYWVDNIKEKMYVANSDGSHMLKFFNVETLEVSSMAVDPNEGWIFWANLKFGGQIETSHLDGTAHHVIASYEVTRPNSLTLDLVKKRVYWVDKTRFSISYCNYNGTDRNVLITLTKSNEALSIAVFEDWIYWAQKNNKVYRIHKTVKDDQRLPELILGNISQSAVSMIKVYHPYQQPNGDNHCAAANNPCAHVCFPNHNTESSIPYICKCSIGYKLQPDGKTCLIQRKDFPEIMISIIGAITAVVILVLLFIYRELLCKVNYSGALKFRREINDEEDSCQIENRLEEYAQIN